LAYLSCRSSAKVAVGSRSAGLTETTSIVRLDDTCAHGQATTSIQCRPPSCRGTQASAPTSQGLGKWASKHAQASVSTHIHSASNGLQVSVTVPARQKLVDPLQVAAPQGKSPPIDGVQDASLVASSRPATSIVLMSEPPPLASDAPMSPP